MKRSSIAILAVIFLLFAVIQGWMLREKFFSPTIDALSASLMGETMMVGTPVSGIVRSVNVVEGQHVEKGQPLFMIFEQSPLDANAGTPIAIVAQRAGKVYDISAIPDSFVQASQFLARIVDTSPEGLYVRATLPMSPEELPSVQPGKRAVVRGTFLEDGKPLTAVITSIGFYDAEKHTVEVRLRMVPSPLDLQPLIVGLPVDVSLNMREDAATVLSDAPDGFPADADGAAIGKAF